jgi:hypothetical protein
VKKAALLFVLTSAYATVAGAATTRPFIVTSQDHSLVEVDDCDHFHTRNTSSFPSQVQAQEERRVPIAGIDLLKIRASEEGGVSVKGWDRPIARLTICKYAVGLTDADARRTLGKLNVTYHNGEIGTSGPEADQTQAWWVHMILRVPKSSNLDVSSSNGGIAIRNMNGKVIAHATNGGISLAQCAGENKVSTENGGISLDKVMGHIDAATQNGSISLKLRDVTMPGIEARTEGEGEIFCRVKGCDEAGAWSSSRKVLHLGGASSPTIRLSTIRAAIMIEQVQ